MWGMVIDPHAALCRRHWWRNMLYIHNYFGFEDMVRSRVRAGTS